MYIVTIQNGTIRTEIHNEHHKIFSGSIVKGINTIDSFSFSLLPDNPGFTEMKDFTTLVEVYNTKRNRYEFRGRVLCTSPQMNDKGLITLEVTCENFLGFLHDSRQYYVEERDWTVQELLSHIITTHNSQVEEYKRFTLRGVDVTVPDNSLCVELQRESSWDAIKKKLIDVLGGELYFEVDSDGVMILEYVEKIGSDKSTEIALSRNMKSIVKEKDPSSFITRLIPLGTKEWSGTEDRIDISSVNDGKNYIDDTEAMAEYGIHVGHVEFDDVEEPSELLEKARDWLKENNKVRIKYSITALDLSLIDLDIDDFEVGNTYPIKNKLLGIDDLARINKKTIDVCDVSKTSIEIGESFKTLSELQREQLVSISKTNENINEIIRDFVTNEKLADEIDRTVSLIEQTEKRITLEVSKSLGVRNLLINYEPYVTISDKKVFDTSQTLKAGQTYTFSADVEIISGLMSGVEVWIGEGLSESTMAVLPIVNGHISGTFTLKADVTTVTVFNGDEDYRGTIKFSKIKLEEGDVETPWNAIDELGSRISVELGKIDLSVYAKKEDLDGISETVKSEISVELEGITSTVSSYRKEVDIILDNVTEIGQTQQNIWLRVRDYEETIDGVEERVSKIEQDSETISLSVSSLQKESNGINLLRATEHPITLFGSILMITTHALSSGQIYTISADVEVLSGSPSSIIAMMNISTVEGSRVEVELPIVNNRISGNITPRANVNGVYLSVKDAQVRVSKLKLEKGETATDWTAAPEEYTTKSEIQITADSILQTVSDNYATKAELALEIVTADDGTKYSRLRGDADVIIFDGNRFEVESEHFQISRHGNMSFIDKEFNLRVTFQSDFLYTSKLIGDEWYLYKLIDWESIIDVAKAYSDGKIKMYD